MEQLIKLDTEQATLALGAALAQSCDLKHCTVIYLSGDLGTGKTTLSRGLLQQLGYSGRVKSPTYSLIESYSLPELTVHHLDLYRLTVPQALENLGLSDYLTENPAIWLIEWPEQGGQYLPKADLCVYIFFQATARQVKLVALSPAGESILHRTIEQIHG